VKIFLDDDIYGKTTSKERRDILFWGENFTFKDLPEGECPFSSCSRSSSCHPKNETCRAGCSRLRCQIYREVERRKNKTTHGHDNDLIGYVDIPLPNITGNQFVEQWYPLQIPVGSTITGKDKSQRLQDGSFNIRIKAKYQAIDILPLQSYCHLQEVRTTVHVLCARETRVRLLFVQYIRREYLRLIRILEPHISLRDKDEIGRLSRARLHDVAVREQRTSLVCAVVCF
jgi:hypothetical protein